jgi:hypothetical protein
MVTTNFCASKKRCDFFEFHKSAQSYQQNDSRATQQNQGFVSFYKRSTRDMGMDLPQSKQTDTTENAAEQTLSQGAINEITDNGAQSLIAIKVSQDNQSQRSEALLPAISIEGSGVNREKPAGKPTIGGDKVESPQDKPSTAESPEARLRASINAADKRLADNPKIESELKYLYSALSGPKEQIHEHTESLQKWLNSMDPDTAKHFANLPGKTGVDGTDFNRAQLDYLKQNMPNAYAHVLELKDLHAKQDIIHQEIDKLHQIQEAPSRLRLSLANSLAADGHRKAAESVLCEAVRRDPQLGTIDDSGKQTVLQTKFLSSARSLGATVDGRLGDAIEAAGGDRRVLRKPNATGEQRSVPNAGDKPNSPNQNQRPVEADDAPVTTGDELFV